ncbi:YebG family protein [Marinobacter sp. BGYM27]|uniref:YebG family protein n=1 Tax=Marinobacter sp. BGYM27 TaxID=2975597 RepID=UPI0021A670E7|nr:YebG family protein [Marinobacter sp. BGYM27]MDG5499922.1 YebG family protein [Marinobacter sp. BGYM27]
MAVTALYFSERDGQDMALSNPDKMLFTSKADADARDKMLELSEEILVFLQRRVEGLSDELAEQCALAIAEDKDLFQKALKKPELLNQAPEQPAEKQDA